MLKELLAAVADLSIKANGPKTIKVDEQDRTTWLVLPNGEVKPLADARPPINAEFSSVESLVAFVRTEGEPHRSAIWYATDKIVAVLNHRHDEGLDWRNDGGTLELEQSHQYKTLARLADSKTPIPHRELYRLLRTTFSDCMEKCPNLLEVLRTVKVTNDSTVEGTIAKGGGGSLGKAIRQQVTGVGEIPEEITLRIPPFHGNLMPRTWWVDVRCYLECDPGSGTFLFYPLAGEMGVADRQIANGLAEYIGREIANQYGVNEPCPTVYHGQEP